MLLILVLWRDKPFPKKTTQWNPPEANDFISFSFFAVVLLRNLRHGIMQLLFYLQIKISFRWTLISIRSPYVHELKCTKSENKIITCQLNMFLLAWCVISVQNWFNIYWIINISALSICWSIFVKRITYCKILFLWIPLHDPLFINTVLGIQHEY